MRFVGLVVVVSAAVLAAPAAVASPLPATIVLHDGGFAFRDIGFRSRTVELTVVNQGKQPHALAIASASSPGGTPIKQTQTLAPGQSTRLSLALPPGNYRIYSPHDHDRQHGLSAPMTMMSPGVKGGGEMNRVFYNF
jgi:Cupredoxin-like domain